MDMAGRVQILDEVDCNNLVKVLIQLSPLLAMSK